MLGTSCSFQKENIFRCLGVWDTVQPMYVIDALHLNDTMLPASVDVALHAVSLQENRKGFLPTLFTLADGSDQILKEVRHTPQVGFVVLTWTMNI
jgi:Uncharacterized alpha/beta hydrolase domain (DUF2235)